MIGAYNLGVPPQPATASQPTQNVPAPRGRPPGASPSTVGPAVAQPSNLSAMSAEPSVVQPKGFGNTPVLPTSAKGNTHMTSTSKSAARKAANAMMGYGGSSPSS